MSTRMLSRFVMPVVAVTMVAVLLSGCSAGSSSFGNNKLDVAEISNIGEYTADGALAQAKAHFRNNDFGKSATFYKRAVELNPSNAEAYVGLGASYDRLRRFDLSDRVYASLFKLTGGTAQYYNNLGYSNLLRGNLSAALKNFQQASRLAPDSIIIANNIQLVQDAQRRA
jgi:Flp pilus assembly protein TadD